MFDTEAQNEIETCLYTYRNNYATEKVLVDGELLTRYQKEHKEYEEGFNNAARMVTQFRSELLERDTIIAEHEQKIQSLTAILDKIAEALKG